VNGVHHSVLRFYQTTAKVNTVVIILRNVVDGRRPGFQHFCVLQPLFGDLGATYDDHLRLIGKRVVDFLLVLIELFSLGVTAEELRANIG